MKQIYLLITTITMCLIRLTHSVCHSVEVKNQHDLAKLQNCTIVIGHVSLSNFQLFNTPDISLPLQEVTGYVLVYRLEGLTSLEEIFPKLTIIRGYELLFAKYALVVFENLNLRNLGLRSLLKVQNGAVLIESNPVLCFTNTVNWVYLLEDHLQQHISLKNNKSPKECAFCPDYQEKLNKTFFANNCWNLNNLQQKKSKHMFKNCSSECGNDGCTKDRKCCSHLCLTGCSLENCHICNKFRDSLGKCVESCNLSNYMIADLCITGDECHNKGYITYGKSCVNECPKSHQHVFINGRSLCKIVCNRNFTIRSKTDLELIKGCTIIQGSLSIELRHETSYIIGDLERVLGEIKEISGYLRIIKSPQVVSLGFLKKLDTIKGDNLIDGEISFYVVDNAYLEDIWPENHKVAILNGRPFFHLNPRLCYDKITALIASLRSYDEIRVQDASRNSNGERVTCGRDLQILNSVVEETNTTAARIKVDHRTSSEKDIILGYIYFFKEAPAQNITTFDGLHGCGRDSWQMDITTIRNVRHIIKNLKPFTQYAFFVKTFIKSVYPTRQDWYSSIQYFRTNATKPGPVQKIYATTKSSTTITVYWWPPKHPNGIITKYMLHFEPRKHEFSNSTLKQEPLNLTNTDCECGRLKLNRDPLPSDSDYYNRNQVIVDNALPNLIFISRQTLEKYKEEMRLEDSTRRKREKKNSSKEMLNKTSPIKSKFDKKQEQIKVEEYTEELFKVHMAEIEKKSLLEQDTGALDFQLVQSRSICSLNNPTIEQQMKENCIPLEHPKGINVPGEKHFYKLQGLESGTVYKISVRACVEELANGCGPAMSVEISTVTKLLEKIIHTF